MLEQYKLPNLDKRENRLKIKVNKDSETCGNITNDLTFMSSMSQKERRKKL